MFKMRRREKFVISSIVLSIGLLSLQLVDLDYRYLAVLVFVLATYFVSAWSLFDDLQRFEWMTILPSPTLYAASVALFYFLLPEGLLSRVFTLVLFGVGMYGLYLTSNIFSVAKGRTIQLVHAAHAVGLLFTLITSLLMTNTIFSLRLPFYFNGLLVGLSHAPLIIMSIWSVNLEPRISREVLSLSGILTLVMVEFAIIFSFYPLSIWNSSLLLMSFLYIGLGLFHNYMRGILFRNTITEYSLVGVFTLVLFFFLFPWK
jgi:hypothetical protein